MYRPFMSLMAAVTIMISGIFAGMFPAWAQTPPAITDVKIGYDGRGTTRVVIFATENLDYAEHAFVEGGLRYVLDFERVRWAIPGGTDSKGEGDGVGGIQRFRYAHYQPTVSRLVFDLDEPVIVDSAFSAPPDHKGGMWRLVIDFKRADIETFKQLRPGSMATEPEDDAGKALVLTPQASSSKTPPPAAAFRRPVIVIDAGHGGRDPGTTGLTKGIKEKDVNLKAALKLRDLLKASGKYDIIMTRETDIIVEYEERIRIARDADADLFISIHADAAGNQSVQGASVYTLSEKGDKRLESKLKDGDWDMPLEVHSIYDEEPDEEVEQILVSLMTRETLTHSSEFAEILIPQMAEAGPVLRNTHRQANYYVLLSPNVPAVLLEIGFLSNANDEARLATDSGIDKSMRSVKHAIDIYFDSKKQRASQYDAAGFFSRAG